MCHVHYKPLINMCAMTVSEIYSRDSHKSNKEKQQQ